MTNLKLFGKSALWLVVGVVLTLMTGNAILAADAVTIESFTASSTMINSGDTVELKWKVTGASEVRIYGINEREGEAVPAESSLEVWPLSTTSYVLIARGLDGAVVSRALTVNVDAKGDVKIESFTATATLVQPGETALLSWKVINSVAVRLISINEDEQAESMCLAEGFEYVWPQKTTTFLLEATGVKGEITSAAITVNVAAVPKPKILIFKATKTEIASGELVILKWATENVVSCSLVTSDGDELKERQPVDSIAVTPNKTLTYTLIACGLDGSEITAEVKIIVL
jgi:hypothetical protein